MTTYRTTNLGKWNDTRRGVIELDAIVHAYLGDPEITDRDRIAFALRELRKRGYDVEACPVDWTKPLMISSIGDSDSQRETFGEPKRSKLSVRLDLIARRVRRLTEEESDCLHGELYPEEKLFDHNDFLEKPYEFSFQGYPELVESVFQAVGFATRYEIMLPDDASEPHYLVKVAPPTMVIA